MELKFKDGIQLAIDDINAHRRLCFSCWYGAMAEERYACPVGNAFYVRLEQEIALDQKIRELNPHLINA